MKYGELTLGQVEAIVNKLGGHDKVLRFLRGELIVTESERNWREENGVIYLTVTSNGKTVPEWIQQFEGRGYRIGEYAENILRSSNFIPTDGVTTNIAVLRGALFKHKDRTTKNIHSKAECRNLIKPSVEISCLIRERFSGEDIEKMELSWIAVMHEPIRDSDGDLGHLCVRRYRDGDGCWWLDASPDHPSLPWRRGYGFAFVVPQR